ncbi:bifunctional ADP-heptose synthase [Chlamydiales bacterium]|nr:bifunctional ADP-heptose synthase [Chlamydiales bacterium]
MSKTISSLKNCTKPVAVLVAGDFILDTYTLGKVTRISPEAPVPVVHVSKETHLPGGAGNVVINLISLGANVIALGRLGNDREGDILKNTLKSEGVSSEHLLTDDQWITTTKNRIISDGQQIVRVDKESNQPLPQKIEDALKIRLSLLVKQVDVIALSDYNKGFLTDSLICFIIEEAKKWNIPVVVDPKGSDYRKYAGCSVIKPNLKEVIDASYLPPDAPFEDHALNILEQTRAHHLVATLAEKGMVVINQAGESTHFPVKKKEVVDVTGAGDTVLATFVFAQAKGLSIDDSIDLSNSAAGIVVERFGCARVTLSELLNNLLISPSTDEVSAVTTDSCV